MIWTYHRLVGIPRVAAIEHPFGRPFGDVDDANRQRHVLRAALQIAHDAQTPGEVHHLPDRWHQPPKDVKWHPAEPSPIIALLKQRQSKRSS